MIEVGTLVKINDKIPEFVELMGDKVGVVVEVLDDKTTPRLFEIYWQHNEIEKLYEDEIVVADESR